MPSALSTAALSPFYPFFGIFGFNPFLYVGAQVIVINQHTFKIIKELGKGGFGIVFKAIDVDTGGVVAIKQQTQDPSSPKNWFLEEIKNHKTISENPSVPRVPKFNTSSDVVSQSILHLARSKTQTSHPRLTSLGGKLRSISPPASFFLPQLQL